MSSRRRFGKTAADGGRQQAALIASPTYIVLTVFVYDTLKYFLSLVFEVNFSVLKYINAYVAKYIYYNTAILKYGWVSPSILGPVLENGSPQ